MSKDYGFGPFILDRQRGRLLREGRPVAVSSKGLRLLEALLGSPGRVLTKTELMLAAWGDAAVEESNLSVQIAALRKQLGPTADGGEWITTIPRMGYRFVGLPPKEAIERVAEPKTSSTERERRPSIAVLPFANVSCEKEQEYLADGITEDIITALTRFRWFFVIARNSSFAYKGRLLDAKQVAQELGVQYLLDASALARAERPDTNRGNRLTGVVKFFNHSKAYGFINGDDAADYFVHADDVTRGPLSAGDAVEFWTTANPRNGKTKAIAVSVIGE